MECPPLLLSKEGIIYCIVDGAVRYPYLIHPQDKEAEPG